MLCDEQERLLELVLTTGDFAKSADLLLRHETLVDDELLRDLLRLSAHRLATNDAETAAIVAHLGVQVSHRGSRLTAIDLHLAAGNASLGAARYRPSARWYFSQASEIGAALDPTIQHAQALAMLAQLDIEDGNTEVGINGLKNASRLAQLTIDQPGAHDIFDQIMLVLGKNWQNEGNQEWKNEFLAQILPATRVQAFRILGIPNTAPAMDVWLRARAKYAFELGDVPNDKLMTVGSDLHTLLQSRLSPVNQQPAATDVLIDRLMSGLPVSRMWLTLDSIRSDLPGAAVLLHELTHFINFGGSLGQCLTVITTGLFVMETLLTNYGVKRRDEDRVLAIPPDHTLDNEALHVLVSYANGQAKLQMLLDVWRPWTEGLAVFSEVDLDLTTSGDLWSLHSMFLCGLSLAHVDLKSDASVPTELRASARDTSFNAKLALAEAVQHEIRTRRLMEGYPFDLLATDVTDASLPYFAGYSFIRALWNRWACRCQALKNSCLFFEALLWLTASIFDDLIPDWTLSAAEFHKDLLGRMRRFLHTLVNVPHDRLVACVDEIQRCAGVALRDGRSERPTADQFDLWQYIQTGHRRTMDAETVSVLARRLESQMKETISGGPVRLVEQYTRLWSELSSLCGANNGLHLLSEVECEVRLLGEPPERLFFCVGRSASEGSRTGMLMFSLLEDEYRMLCDENQNVGHGRSQLLQFISVKQGEQLLVFEFPTAIRYGTQFFVPRALRLTSYRGGEVTDFDVARMRTFIADRERLSALRRPLASPASDFVSLMASLLSDTSLKELRSCHAMIELGDARDDAEGTAVELYLACMTMESAKTRDFKRRRFEAMFPEDPDLRYVARKTMQLAMQQPAGVGTETVARVLGTTRDRLIEDLESIQAHTQEVWSQKLFDVSERAIVFRGVDFTIK